MTTTAVGAPTSHHTPPPAGAAPRRSWWRRPGLPRAFLFFGLAVLFCAGLNVCAKFWGMMFGE